MLAALTALLSAPAGAYEIYTQDMEENFDLSQKTFAPCDNSGYFTNPPSYDLGACQACAKSIRAAKEKVEEYPNLCQHTHSVEVANANDSASTAHNTQRNQWNTQMNGGHVQYMGSSYERQKRDDAGGLREKAEACIKAVKCDGQIAPEDLLAGRTEKKACRGLSGGAQLVWDEKNSHVNEMSSLGSRDLGNAANLSDVTGMKIAGGLDSVGAALGAAGPALTAAGVFTGSGTNGGNFLPSGAFGNPGAGSLFDTRMTTGFANANGKGAPLLSWSDYMQMNSLAGLKNDDGRTAGLLWSMSSQGRHGAGLNGASLPGTGTPGLFSPGEAVGGARPGKGQASSDPWLNFMSSDASGSRFVERLRLSPSLRDKLRREISEMLAQAGQLTPEQAEKLEFMRRALAQAETMARRGPVEKLDPLDVREAFSMDADETEREVNRLLASIDGGAPVEDTTRPLFGRVHRALQRQVANGNLGWREMLKIKGRTR